MVTSTRFWQTLIITSSATFLIHSDPGIGQQRMENTSRRAAISGHVLTAGTLKPAARVRVQLTTTDASQSASAISGANGAFMFGSLPAGRYWVRAEGDRLQTTYHGQRSPSDFPRSIVLRDGQQVTDIEIVPPEFGVLVGRVMNPYGEAVERAHVVAVANDLRIAQTNDVGDFRIPRLVPGRYLVWAIAPEPLHADRAGAETYAMTFAPNTVEMESADRVAVTYGSESSTGDIVLTPGHVSDVLGRVVTADGRPALDAIVTLGVEEFGYRSSLNLARAEVRTSGVGDFAFARVPEGRYTLRATLGNQQGALKLIAPLRTREPVSIVVYPIASLSGQLSFEPGAKAICRTAVVAALPLDAPAAADRAAQVAAVHPDGTFRLTELSGRQQIEVRCGRDVFARIRRMVVNGSDMAGNTLDAATLGPGATLKVAAAPPANKVLGKVLDLRGEPGAGLAVVVRADPDTWRMPFQYVWTSVIVKGQYRIEGLPPGNYLAFHEPPRRIGELQSPEYLHMVRARGTAFEIPEEGEIEVPLICH